MRASAITGRRVLAVSVLSMTALLSAACGSGTPAPVRTVTVTAAPPASAPPSPAAPGSPAAGPQPCQTAGLRLAIGRGDGAAGTIYWPLRFTNISGSACTLYGYPGAVFVKAPHGAQLGAPAGRRGPAPTQITLQPGATAHATLAVSNVTVGNDCMGHQTQVHWVQVYPPGQYTALYGPLNMLGCADKSLVVMYVTTVTSGP